MTKFLLTNQTQSDLEAKGIDIVAANQLKTEGFSHRRALRLIVTVAYYKCYEYDKHVEQLKMYTALFPEHAEQLKVYAGAWRGILCLSDLYYEAFKDIPDQKDYALAVKNKVSSRLLFQARKLGSFQLAVEQMTVQQRMDLLDAALACRKAANETREKMRSVV